MTDTVGKPGFIGIGVQKCATTWIYDILRDHPEVGMSATKEVNFFSYHYDHGFQWYGRQFPRDADVRVRGEISPSYFHDPAAPGRAAGYAPEAKLLVSLRDPVERAISNHKHEVRVGHFSGSDVSFEAGLANNPGYIDQGLYATHLERWLEYFPADRVLVVLFDDIVRDPAGVAQGIYRFLGVDENHLSTALYSRSNSGHLKRSLPLHAARRRVRAAVTQAGFGWAWETMARLGLRRIYRKYNWRPAEGRVPTVSAESRGALRERFKSEVVQLEAIIGRSLVQWRSEEGETGPEEEFAPDFQKSALFG